MHPVGDDKDAASFAIVEPRKQNRVEGIDCRFDPINVIANVVRIVDNDHMCATSGDTATKRRHKNAAA